MLRPMAMLGPRPLVRHALRRRVPSTILGLVIAGSLIATAGVAAQSIDWVRNPGTGHWYGVVHDMPWAEGEAYAVSIGGHLATINDEAEDRWISATFESAGELLIGLNDTAREGAWVWVSGEPVTYTNWLPGEPTDGPEWPEDVVEINFVGPTGAYGWNDHAGVDLPLLIEVESPVAPPAEIATATPGAKVSALLTHTRAWFDTPDVMVQRAISLEAYTHPVGGTYEFVTDDGRFLYGEVTCSIVVGPDAWISGPATLADAGFSTGMAMFFRLRDGGALGADQVEAVVESPDEANRLCQTRSEDYALLPIDEGGILIEVNSPVATPVTTPTAPPTARPTSPPTATPTALPAPTPTPTPSPPAASANPQPTASIVVIVIGGGGSGAGYRLADPSVPVITRFIPTPADLAIDPSVIWTNLLLAGVVMVMLIIATELLNRSLGELEPVLAGRFPVVRRLQRGMARLDAATLQRLAARRHRLVDVARLAAIAAFYGVVFALLDPTWDPLSLAGLWLVVMMALAAGIVGLGGDICAWAVGRRWGVVGDLEIRAGSLLAAVGSTLVSRALVIVPGVMIGSPEVIEVDPERVDRRRLGIIAAVGMGTVLLIGLVAWALTLATSAMRGSAGGLETALAAAEAFLLLVFAFAIQNAFVQLLSLRQSGGLALRRTHPVWWGATLLLVSFAFWQTLVNPSGDLASALHNRNALVFLAAAGLVLFVSLAVWVGTRLTWLRVAEPGDSAAVRAIDLQRTFTLGPKALAEKLGIDTGLAKALRWHLDIEHDPVCRHDFVFGRMKVPMYSNKALERMRDAIAGGTNLGEVRRAYQAAGRP